MPVETEKLFSLWDRIKFEKFDEVGEIVVNSSGVIQKYGKKLKWFGQEQSSFELENEGRLIPVENSDLIALIHHDKISFQQPSYTGFTEYYSVKIDPKIQIKNIKIWCLQPPAEFARIVIFDESSIHCYCYEDDELKYMEKQLDFRCDGMSFINQDFFYAWNSDSIYRFCLLDDRIEIFHQMVNLVQNIKKIVATPRFMLIHSENQIISACQHTGIQIAQISSEKFNEIDLFDDKDAKHILITIKRDEVKVLELNQCGFIVSDVFSLSSSSIVETKMGSRALYMKNLDGHFWISKWSPEQKLQRLILDGTLMKAKQFADHHGLEGESIKQKELEYLVRQDQKHSRIQELLNEIQDENFLFDFGQRTQGTTDAEQILLEHIDTIVLEDDLHDLYCNELKNNTEKWFDLTLDAIKQGHYTTAKNELIKHIQDLDEESVGKTFFAITKDVKYQNLSMFLDGLLPVLMLNFQASIRTFLPKWIVERVTAFETSDPKAWPTQCLDLISMIHRDLSTFDENAVKPGDLWRKGISQLVVLRSHLYCIADLKEKYNIRITFKQFNEFLLHSRWEIKLVEHILETKAQCDLEQTLNQFVMPFLNANGISTDELVWTELQKPKYSDESKIVLICSLEDSNKKKAALLDIIRLVNKPWPKSLQELVTSILMASRNQ